MAMKKGGRLVDKKIPYSAFLPLTNSVCGGIIAANGIFWRQNMEPILEYIKKLKKEAGYTNEDLAEKSGLPLSTVQKVMSGITKSPRMETVQALMSVFMDKEASAERLQEAQPVYAAAPQPYYPFTNAPAGKYPRQGSYTLKDYLALPDDQRVELIDGVIYDMSAPSIPHQEIGGEVFARIRSFLISKKSPCKVFMSPVDVQLDRDDRTVLEPDVMVVCDRSKITRARIVGAPDFVAEVLSPGTRQKDAMIKTKKYRLAGVREYWMIDPDKKLVHKLLFLPPTEELPDGDTEIISCSFDTPVPVSLFGDELTIDFLEIAAGYGFLEDGEYHAK